MKLNKFTVILAVLLISIMAIGAVSAESVDDSGAVAIDDDAGDIQESVGSTDTAKDLGSADAGDDLSIPDTADDVSSADAEDDLSISDTADETVEDTGSAILGDEPKSYDLSDDTYSTYFNEDGTATELINESSDYTLNVGTLNNKDIKIAYGSHINIIGKENEGIINNGTITIGTGSGEAASILISGLTFTNTNKDGIHVNDLTNDVTIKNNKFDLTFDSSCYNAMGIATYGYLYNVTIDNNDITINSAATNTYGIVPWFYLPDQRTHGMSNAEEFVISNNNITLVSTYQLPDATTTGCVEGMYLDTMANSVVKNNKLNIKSINEGVANYGMQVADSWGWYDGTVNSPHNVTIKENDVVLESADMAYGLSVIALWNEYDVVTYGDIVFNMYIVDNNVTINSSTGAVGIGAESQDVTIKGNNITIKANPFEDVHCYADPAFGNESCAIYINNYGMMGAFPNNTATFNNIKANVNPIKIASDDLEVVPLVSDNTIASSLYIIDEIDYDIYFDLDGTPRATLPAEGKYFLFIDTLNNKDIKILTGENIYIIGKEGAGIINGGTITIGNGAEEISEVTVGDLTFTNVNKDGIVVEQYAKNIAIVKNKFNLTYDDTYAGSPMAIVTYEYVDDVIISGNEISMESAAQYTYGIDLSLYKGWSSGIKNAKNFLVYDNIINIVSTYIYTPPDVRGMAEGIYADTIIDSVIENNTITITTTGDGAANYGMQVADSSEWAGDSVVSPYNVSIAGNTIVLDSNDMAIGIGLISSAPMTSSKDFVISNNDVTIISAKGGMGIGVYSSDVEIAGNKLNIAANADAENHAYIDYYLGSVSTGIFVNNADSNTNVTIKNNDITTNVKDINVSSETGPQPAIEGNEVKHSVFIDDTTYDTYFNTEGTIKTDAPINDGDILLLGDLTGKKLVLDRKLIVNAAPNKKLANSTIKVTAGADGLVIDGINMVNDIKASTAVIYIEEVNNVTVSNCVITIPSATKMAYAIEVGPGTNGCNNININNNKFDITSSYNYVYGIDVYQDESVGNRHKNINIFENTFIINSTGKRMAEAIYVTASEDVIIDGNIMQVISNGTAYGIATDRIANEVIANNKITLEAATMAYGIAATTEGANVIIRANEINAKGIGAVGVGINNQTGVTIEDNTIAIVGGDYTSIIPSDSLGTANAGILIGDGNTNVKSSGNDVTETSSVRLNTTFDVSDVTVTAAPSGNGNLQVTLKTVSGMLLANQTVKVVFDNKVSEFTTDANGVIKLPFALNKAGVYNVDIFYLGDDNYRGSDATAKITINKIATKTTSAAKTYLATASNKAITATLKDAKGKALANKKVSFTVNGKTVTATTNSKGVATAKLSLTAAKTYNVAIKFAGDNVYAASTVSAKVKLNKEATKLNAPKKTFKKSAKTKKVVIILKNSKGKAIAGKKVTLVVNKKKYTVKTNKKGQAVFKVKLTKKGNFKYTVKFAGDSQYKASKKNGKIRIK